MELTIINLSVGREKAGHQLPFRIGWKANAAATQVTTTKWECLWDWGIEPRTL